MKNEVCVQCPDIHTDKCETCKKRTCRVCGCTWDNACPGGCYWVEFDLCSACEGKELTSAKLTYTFYIPEDICMIDDLHSDLDILISVALGMDVIKSTLTNEDECSEHDYESDPNT